MPNTPRPSRWAPALAVVAVAVAALGTVLASWWAQRHPAPALQAKQDAHATGATPAHSVKSQANAGRLRHDAGCRDCVEPRRLREDRS